MTGGRRSQECFTRYESWLSASSEATVENVDLSTFPLYLGTAENSSMTRYPSLHEEWHIPPRAPTTDGTYTVRPVLPCRTAVGTYGRGR